MLTRKNQRRCRFNGKDYALNVLRVSRPEIARRIISEYQLGFFASFADVEEAFNAIARSGIRAAVAAEKLRDALIETTEA